MSVSKIERRITDVLMAIPLLTADGRYYCANGTFTDIRTPIIIMRGDQNKVLEPDYCMWEKTSLISKLGVTTYSDGRLTVDNGVNAWAGSFMLIPTGRWIPS